MSDFIRVLLALVPGASDTHQVVHKQHHYCADRHAFFLWNVWILIVNGIITSDKAYDMCKLKKKKNDNFCTTKLNLSQGKVCVVIVALFAVLVTAC